MAHSMNVLADCPLFPASMYVLYPPLRRALLTNQRIDIAMKGLPGSQDQVSRMMTLHVAGLGIALRGTEIERQKTGAQKIEMEARLARMAKVAHSTELQFQRFEERAEKELEQTQAQLAAANEKIAELKADQALKERATEERAATERHKAEQTQAQLAAANEKIAELKAEQKNAELSAESALRDSELERQKADALKARTAQTGPR